VRDCTTILEGVNSNHRAVTFKLTLTSIKVQQSCAISKGATDWRKIQSDEHLRMVYNEHLQSMITPTMDYDEYNAAVLKAGELTMTVTKQKCAGWFQLSHATLALLLSKRNRFLHAVKHASHLPQSVQSTMQADLKRLNRHIPISVSNTKAKWYAQLCLKIHNMPFNPRVAWEHICLLAKGETAHHQKNSHMAMWLPDETRATNSSENMSVFGPHFTKVFNNHRPVDPTILQHIPQCHTLWELNDPNTWEEFCCAVCKLKNVKAAGLTGVPPEAFKAMSPANSQHVYEYVNQFFMRETDYEQWHRSQCVPVPKSGDLSDPNKWQGIMLMDVCSKIFSSVMNARAFKLLAAHGTRFQFGGTPELGCRDGLFVLKTMLNMQKTITSCHMLDLLNWSRHMILQTMTYSLISWKNMGPLHDLHLQSSAYTKTSL
jgi:hypothetical protein